MEILFANVMGFCFGVRRAVELAQKSLNENCGKKVYSLGPLIHNEKVLEVLKQKGLNIIEENDIDGNKTSNTNTANTNTTNKIIII